MKFQISCRYFESACMVGSHTTKKHRPRNEYQVWERDWLISGLGMRLVGIWSGNEASWYLVWE